MQKRTRRKTSTVTPAYDWQGWYKKMFFVRFSLLLVTLVLTIMLAFVQFCVVPRAERYADKPHRRAPRETPKHNSMLQTATASTIDTSTWTSYINAEYGFQFKYPETFIQGVSEEGQLVTMYSTTAATDMAMPRVSVKVSDRYSTFEELEAGVRSAYAALEADGGVTIQKRPVTETENALILKFGLSDDSESNTKKIYFFNNDLVYIIQYYPLLSEDGTKDPFNFEAVLSTFQFVP